MKRDALPVLAARGVAGAATCWKALLLALGINAAFAVAVAYPVGNALHRALDESPYGARMAAGTDASFYRHFTRRHPDVLGDLGPLDAFVTGEKGAGAIVKAGGAAGALIAAGLLQALVLSVLAGGFAGRLGSTKDRGSLSAFGADCGRFAFSSLVLGAISVAGLAAAYRFVFVATGDLYEPSELRYEWEAVGLSLARLALFLLVAGLIRLAVIYARASTGVTRNGDPFRALAAGASFVARRPIRTLALEAGFSAAALLPLVLWGFFGPTWDGRDPGLYVAILLGQQAIVAARVLLRTAHLGAASAFLVRSSEGEAAPSAPAPHEPDGATA